MTPPSLFQVAFSAIVLLSVLFPAPMNGQLSELLELVPKECMEVELNDVTECYFENLVDGCSGLLSVLTEDSDGLIPTPDEIVDCTDIEEPYCTIAKECQPCDAAIRSFTQCIISNSVGVDENITALVESCPLSCTDDESPEVPPVDPTVPPETEED